MKWFNLLLFKGTFVAVKMVTFVCLNMFAFIVKHLYKPFVIKMFFFHKHGSFSGLNDTSFGRQHGVSLALRWKKFCGQNDKDFA